MAARFPRPGFFRGPARLRLGVDLLLPDLGVGNLRLRDRQRHVAAGLDHVDVIAAGRAAAVRMGSLLAAILPGIG